VGPIVGCALWSLGFSPFFTMIAKKPDGDPSDVQSISGALTQELVQPYPLFEPLPYPPNPKP